MLLFQKEKEYLQPLPNRKVIESYLSHDHQINVQKDSLITYKGNRYPVPPAHIGKTVLVRQQDDKLMIYYNTKTVAVHNLSVKKLNYQKEHYTELLFPLISDIETVAAMVEANLKQMDDFL